MKIKRTRTRTRNEPRRIKTVPLAMGPTRHSHDGPLVYTLRTDDDLVNAAQSGDHEAFAELCRRHAQPVRHKILAIVRHQEDAEDALQETLLRAYANLGRFRQSCKFSTWITAIGINAALAVIRKRKTRREADMEPDGVEGSIWDVADQGSDPERCAAKGQIILFLRRKIQALPPKMQEAIRDKRAIVGMDREEVEAAMGKPDRKVRERDANGNDIEDWIYGHPPLATTFVRFMGDKVSQIDQYQ